MRQNRAMLLVRGALLVLTWVGRKAIGEKAAEIGRRRGGPVAKFVSQKGKGARGGGGIRAPVVRRVRRDEVSGPEELGGSVPAACLAIEPALYLSTLALCSLSDWARTRPVARAGEPPLSSRNTRLLRRQIRAFMTTAACDSREYF